VLIQEVEVEQVGGQRIAAPDRHSDTDTALIVASRAMTELLSIAERAAKSPAKVLITGESGVGKDVVAHFIHNQSPRKSAPFVAVNCAGLIEALLESDSRTG
jgi:two-component system response regulator FlrC